MNKQKIEKVLDGLKRMRIAMFNYCIDGERVEPFLDTAISALEKQIPRKPQEVDVDFSTFVCPNCLSTIMYTDEKETHNYCLKCGQRLDWSVEE